jgi:hypothetical protein
MGTQYKWVDFQTFFLPHHSLVTVHCSPLTTHTMPLPPLIHILCQLNIHSLRSAHLKPNIYDFVLQKYKSMTPHPLSSMVLPPHAQNVAQIMVESATLVPCHMLRCHKVQSNSHHPYIDGKIEECNDSYDNSK